MPLNNLQALNLGAVGEDHAKAPGMRLVDLERMLDDTRLEPDWRTEADICAEFYDGNQRTQSEIAELEARGMAPLSVNLIKPSVDLVLGMEARNRRDWRVRADDDKHKPVADAMNERLHEAERMTKADRGISDAFKASAVAGLGWVEVSRQSNPFKYPYRCGFVHRREIWWDWRGGLSPDMEQNRWLVRRRWMDYDHVQQIWPQHQELIEHALNGWSDWDYGSMVTSPLLAREWAYTRDTTLDELEWRDSERRRVTVYECWYRTMHRGLVMRSREPVPMPMTLEFDAKNPAHRMAVEMGMVDLVQGVYDKMRLSWWIGPHRVADVPSPLPFDGFPYVPFHGFLEDRTGMPYGVVRAMLDPQREFNARRSKLMWILSAKRVIGDEDAVYNNDWAAVREEAGRPDAMIKLNPSRQNRDGSAFRIETDHGLARDQFEVMVDAAQRIQDAPGIYQAMLGKDDTGSQSGRAINSLVEQGTTTLAEFVDNYDYARAAVGERLLAMIRHDLARQNNVRVTTGPRHNRRTVILNSTQDDPEGITRSNDILRASLGIVIDETPSSPTHRAQQAAEMAEIIKGMAPEMQAAVLDLWLDMTDSEQAEEMADRIRKLTGQMPDKPIEEMDEQELAEYQARQEQMAAQQKAEQKMQQLAQAEIMSKVEAARASAAKAQADIERAKADAARAEQQLRLEHRKMQLQAADQRQRAEAEARRDQWEREKLAAEQRLERAMLERTEATKQWVAELQDQAERRRLEFEERSAQRDARLERVRLQREAERDDKQREHDDRQAQREADREEREAKRAERDQAKAEKDESKTAESAPALPPITVNVDAGRGPVTKKIKVQRGKDGIEALDVDERPAGEKPE